MSELRQKMIRAMELENLSDNTQRRYLAAVTGLAKHYRQSPDQTNKYKSSWVGLSELKKPSVTKR